MHKVCPESKDYRATWVYKACLVTPDKQARLELKDRQVLMASKEQPASRAHEEQLVHAVKPVIPAAPVHLELPDPLAHVDHKDRQEVREWRVQLDHAVRPVHLVHQAPSPLSYRAQRGFRPRR